MGYSNLNEFYEVLRNRENSTMEMRLAGLWMNLWKAESRGSTLIIAIPKWNDGMECCVISALNDPNKFYCD